jgi:hypothetical protein
MAFFSLSSAAVSFLPEGVMVGVQNFAWGFKSHKKYDLALKNIWAPDLPRGSIF